MRALVSETPLATQEHSEATRHADAMVRARDALRKSVADLERRQDNSSRPWRPGSNAVTSAERAATGNGVAKQDDNAAPLACVVIAEDEAIVRLDLKEILVSAGYEVVGETGRGDEAVQLVAEHQPDLATLDVKMPGMDGIRASREITSRHQVAVLLLTAFSQRDLIEEARDSGVAAYLVKPFQPAELLPAIADVLAKRVRNGRSKRSSRPTEPRTRSSPAGSSTRPNRS